MQQEIKLRFAKTPQEISLYWDKFEAYITDLFNNISLGDSDDLDYFFSSEYRDAIHALHARENNPLKMALIQYGDDVIGLICYVIYLDEAGKCYLMEFGIEPQHRNLGLGAAIYSQFENTVKSEGALYIELTPSNHRNTGFWGRHGFTKTDEQDEDGKHYYRKSL